MNRCTENQCTKEKFARTYCRPHYMKVYKEGVVGNYTKQTRLYRIWAGMKSRCNNPNTPIAKYYYEKGISVVEEWKSFSNFEKWALSSGYRDDLTIDRINPTLGYSPSNCCWATYTAQNRHLTPTHMNEVGHNGITWDKQKRKWRADIKLDYKQILLGRYDDVDEAISARLFGESLYWDGV